MARKGKRYRMEEIVRLLKEAESLRSNGQTVGEICRTLNISEASYYKWRTRYAGVDVDEAAEIGELLRQNGQLKKLVADQALDLSILKEALKGKY